MEVFAESGFRAEKLDERDGEIGQRVSVQSVAPSPAAITGLPASIRCPRASPSLNTDGKIDRTVWLGRTMVQGSPLEP